MQHVVYDLRVVRKWDQVAVTSTRSTLSGFRFLKCKETKESPEEIILPILASTEISVEGMKRDISLAGSVSVTLAVVDTDSTTLYLRIFDGIVLKRIV